jgi:hypothetical protein
MAGDGEIQDEQHNDGHDEKTDETYGYLLLHFNGFEPGRARRGRVDGRSKVIFLSRRDERTDG